MALYGASVNTSPVIVGTAGADITSGAFYLVKADAGKMKKCATAGEAVFGVLIAQTPSAIKTNDELTVQVTGIAPVICGGTIAMGAELAVDANGKAVTCTPTENFTPKAFGVALEAGSAGKVIQVKLY